MNNLARDEVKVLQAVEALNRWGRSTNTAQVAARAVLPRTRAQRAAVVLKGRGLLCDVSKGSAYHWRLTDEGRAALGATEPEPDQEPPMTPRLRTKSSRLHKGWWPR